MVKGKIKIYKIFAYIENINCGRINQKLIKIVTLRRRKETGWR